MHDRIEMIGKSKIQHGGYNNRIYLMKLNSVDFPDILNYLKNLAIKNSYTKIFAKIPSFFYEGFLEYGYKKEAYIPSFYNGKDDAFFLSKYLYQKRKIVSEDIKEKVEANLELAFKKKEETLAVDKIKEFELRILNKKDIPKLSRIYREVFQSYPFPIFDKEYLASSMKNDVKYFGVFKDNELVAASSAEIDINYENAEMTDFATLKNFTGNNLSLLLLRKMEEEMNKKNIKTLYTIARSLSAGMNITFAKQKYEYSGTLINNTNIAGQIENMNVWYKTII